MSSISFDSLKRYIVAGIPIIKSIINKINLHSIFSNFIPNYGNENIPVGDTLIILLINMTLGRHPLYQLNQWLQQLDNKCLNIEQEDIQYLNDDRFARALDKLYLSDRASLITEIVVNMVSTINLDLSRIHNDSTSVKAYGNIPGITKSGLILKRGKSKDHRPDLKQLVFSLSISADGAVPVHYKTYPGNRTDDTTHIETWNTIKKITGKSDFIYVADCKVCTKDQLSYIVEKGGKVVTIMPKTWQETKKFKNELRENKITKQYLWSKKIAYSKKTHIFSLFDGNYTTGNDKYKVYWIHSNEKQRADYSTRMGKLKKAEKKLTDLYPKINKRNLKTQKQIIDKINEILKQYNVADFIDYNVSEIKNEEKKQQGKGRPGKTTKYKTIINITYSISWNRNKNRLKKEKNVDGIFPLLCTDDSLSPKEAIKYYKYQPRLEKRFTQFKSVHNAAPLLFKKIERVEALMFLFFLSLMIQAIIEREIRIKMKKNNVKKLMVYPESRSTAHPTTTKILELFEYISSYQVRINNEIKEFKDPLNEIHQQILEMLNIENYWG